MTSKYHEIDVTEMPVTVKESLDSYRVAYRDMKRVRQAFEEIVTAHLPQLPIGKAWAFGYNFGKVAVTIMDASERKAATKPKGSLVEWMRDQVANGDRT